MTRRSLWLMPLFLVVVPVLTPAVSPLETAFRFDPVFRLYQFKGTCTVEKPGEIPMRDEQNREIYPSAVQRKAYPYGTRIRTGASSTAQIDFTKRSHFTMRNNTQVLVGEDPADPRIKMVRLESGSIEVLLEKGIEKNSNSVVIETPAAQCLATNRVEFTVEVRQEPDRYMTTVFATQDNISVVNPSLFNIYMNAPEKGREKGLTVSSTLDNNHISVSSIKGIFGMKVRNPKDVDAIENELLALQQANTEVAAVQEAEGLTAEEGHRLIKLDPGATVKFSHRRHLYTDAHMVTTLIMPAGTNRIEEITYNEVKQPPAPLPAAGEGAAPAEGAGTGAPAAAAAPAPAPLVPDAAVIPAVELPKE